MPRNRIRRIITVGVLISLFVLVFAGTAFGAEQVARSVQDAPPTNHTLAFSVDQFWTLVIGALTPLAGYVLNTYAKWVSEPVKAFVQVVLAAVASALYQLLSIGELALNAQTLQLIGSSIVSALVIHRFLWLPSGVGQILGAGQNKNLATTR